MSKSLSSRPVRLSGRHIQAALANRPVEVTNISITGALLVHDEVISVGETAHLILRRGSKGLRLEVRIVRVEPGDQARWQTAVMFVNLSAATRRAIPSLAA